MSDRIPCCIEPCRRTFRREPTDSGDVTIMCGRHWRMGDLTLRSRHKRLRKRRRWLQRYWDRRQNAIVRSGRQIKFYSALARAFEAEHIAWERVREDAQIKAAFGVEDAPRRRIAA